jgi:hypothetical protein
VAERAIGARPVVRDAGLLKPASARPQATVSGRGAYPTLEDKAAALTHSIARNHALVEGSKRLAVGRLIASPLVSTDADSPCPTTRSTASSPPSTGELSDVPDVADRICAADRRTDINHTVSMPLDERRHDDHRPVNG